MSTYNGYSSYLSVHRDELNANHLYKKFWSDVSINITLMRENFVNGVTNIRSMRDHENIRIDASAKFEVR